MSEYLLDTNIIGILVTERDYRRKETIKFLRSRSKADKIIISETVIEEILENPNREEKTKELRTVNDLADSIKPNTSEIEDLAVELKRRVNRKLKGTGLKVTTNDMGLISMAVLYRYKLVTWDYRSILKGKIIKAIKDSLTELGYRPIEMADPSGFLE